ncbi:UNVERIFIED_ORG: hypothetical protein LHK14_19015 [Roseateles sp. XES5]|nr:hypothetical protein [Roseateles sp. XES5]
MRPGIKYIAAATGFSFLVITGMIAKGLLDANDHIDRCDDQTSGRYIFDKEARAIACK